LQILKTRQTIVTATIEKGAQGGSKMKVIIVGGVAGGVKPFEVR
jgi:hypothetical protein